MTLEDLEQLREKLLALRLKGLDSYELADGHKVEYRSDAALGAAIAAADREITKLRGSRPRSIQFVSSKGL